MLKSSVAFIRRTSLQTTKRHMKVIPLPLNDDNYGYFLIDEKTKSAAFVDVSGHPDKVIAKASELGVNLVKILTTHKHWDHAGGNSEMIDRIPHLEIVCSATDAVEACTTHVSDGDTFKIDNICIKCIHTPGHTMGHISYYAVENDEHVVFTGDTLFVGGVGKFFEGTAEDMHNSCKKLKSLPRDTKVYCGHEYTLSNYRFALSVDGDNCDLREANAKATDRRANGLFTIPSTIDLELKTNPFFRTLEDSIMLACGCPPEDKSEAAAIVVMGKVREGKNSFRG